MKPVRSLAGTFDLNRLPQGSDAVLARFAEFCHNRHWQGSIKRASVQILFRGARFEVWGEGKGLRSWLAVEHSEMNTSRLQVEWSDEVKSCLAARGHKVHMFMGIYETAQACWQKRFMPATAVE